MALHALSPRRWFESGEQEFFRLELLSLRQWLFRGAGADWIGGYVVLLILQSGLVVNVKPGVTGYGSLGNAIRTTFEYGWVFILPSLLSIMACSSALYSRTFAPLSGRRGEVLILSGLRAEQLWPALLLGPITLLLFMNAVGSAAGIATFAWWLVFAGVSDASQSNVIWFGFKLYGACLGWLITALQIAAATAWAAWWIHPGGGRVRTLLLTFIAASVFYVLNAATIFLSQAAMFMRWDHFFALNLRDPELYLPYHLAFLPGVIARLALFGSLFWIALRGLRSERSTERWARRLES